MRHGLILAALAGALLVGGAAAAQQRATSAYTALDLRRCTVVNRIEEGASVTWRCPGHQGIPLIVHSSDDRFDIDAGADNGVWESSSRFSSPGARVEWRLRGGRPFAIIYRLVLTGGEAPASSVLAVETIGGRHSRGCVVAWIDGQLPTANALAHARADALAGRFRCGRDSPEQHGKPQ